MISIDLNLILDEVKKGIWKALKLPFELLNRLPPEARYAIIGFIIFLGIAILVAWIKSSGEWRHVDH